MLRVVLDSDAAALVPDPLRRARGRGAWVHRDTRCVQVALDRKALQRALRVSNAVSTDAVLDVLAELISENGTTQDMSVQGTDQTR